MNAAEKLGETAAEAGSRSPSVVLIDDHELVLEGLTRALTGDGMRIAAAFLDGTAALRFLTGGAPEAAAVDLVVVDLRLGDQSGVQLVEQITTQRPDLQVAMLTTFEDRAAASAAVRAGARGFLLKDSLCAELCTGLRKVAEGHLMIDSRLAAAVLTPQRTMLTDHELAILNLVAEGLSNREIGAQLHLSAYTVKDYLSRAMRKLGTTTRTATVLRAVREGLLQEPV